jgi:dTDP-4-dehydrorhamnose 3,5-epimerase
MKITATGIGDVVVIEHTPCSDDRGRFTRLFCSGELASVLGSRHIVQINQSQTLELGAVRGLHYQRSPHAEMKFITCLKGRVWDVAVDLRSGSKSFLRWHAEELNALHSRMIVIPEGCAHGFQALEADSELLYLHTAPYHAPSEGGVQPSDPRLRVPWPLPIVDLSERDRTHPLLSPDFAGLTL